MSSLSRGRGRGGRGIATNVSVNGTQNGFGAPSNSIEEVAFADAIIVDISDSQPPNLNVSKSGILRKEVVFDPANLANEIGSAVAEGQHNSVHGPVPFGGIQSVPIGTTNGRGCRGVRGGGLGRGGVQQNNSRLVNCSTETSPPKSVSFEPSTVFTTGRGRGVRGGRGANAVELNTASIGNLLRGRGRSGGPQNIDHNERERESEGARRGDNRRNEGNGGAPPFGRSGGRNDFGERTAPRTQRGSSSNGGDEHFQPNGGDMRPRPHMYKKRDIQEIFEDDNRASEKYAEIRNEDEDLHVAGDHEKFTSYETWEDFGLEPKLMENIRKSHYVLPRKIQSHTFPLIRDGRDLKAHAETSSGKSAAFLVPIIDRLIKLKKEGKFRSSRCCPYALILSPARELAIQVYEQARKLSDGCEVSVSLAYGGTQRHANIRSISIDGCDILIGTPGRLCDFFQTKYLMADLMKVLVLDEADELLDDKFVLDLRAFEKVPNWPMISARQTLLFTATFSTVVQRWADEWMRSNSLMVTKGEITPNKRIAQTFLMADNTTAKKHMLLRLLQLELEQDKTLNPDNPKLLSTMVFVNTRNDAENVATFLLSHGFKATTINGRRDQALREKAVWDFRSGEFPIIVTTDVCARGHDIKNLERVINMDLPSENTPEDSFYKYVQRIGRTGRIQGGTATSFFDPKTDMEIAAILVHGLNLLSQLVPSWLQDAANGFVQGQGSSLSDQNLLNDAGIAPIPDNVPNFANASSNFL